MRPVVALRVQNGPRIQAVCHRRKPSRLGEADQVGRDGHAHVMASAQELTPDNDGGLDIAATSIACQHKFHRAFWPFSRRARRQRHGHWSLLPVPRLPTGRSAIDFG